MRDQEDSGLRGLFRDLQTEDRKQAPDFRPLMTRVREEASGSGLEVHPEKSRVRRFPRRLAWGGSLLVAAAATVLMLVQTQDTSGSEFERVVSAFSSDPASGAWQSPTDGLLDVPGKEILSTLPSIGTSRWLPDPGPESRRNEL